LWGWFFSQYLGLFLEQLGQHLRLLLEQLEQQHLGCSQHLGLLLEQLVQHLGLLVEQLGQQHLAYFLGQQDSSILTAFRTAVSIYDSI
jgi:predicted component of type VI protein secretion system